MKSQLPQINYMTDALERDMLEQQLRAMAQRAAAEAFARGMRRLFAKVRTVITRARQSSHSGLHSA